MKGGVGFFIALLLMISLIILSIFFLFLAVNAYSRGFEGAAMYYSIAGLMGLVLSTYTLARMILRRPPTPTASEYEVRTILQCLKCGFSNTRRFAVGDYVLGTSDKCPNCLSNMIVVAIYKVDSKKKTKTENQ